MSMQRTSESGQSLIELVVGVAIGIIFITGAVGIIALALRLNFENNFSLAASELTQSVMEDVRVIVNANWHSLDQIAHGSTVSYHLVSQVGLPTIAESSSTIAVNGQDYELSFTIEDVEREGTTDPSTLLIRTHAAWQNPQSSGQVTFASIVGRTRDRLMTQGDWIGGPNYETPFADTTFASSSNINYSIPYEITINNLATTTPVGPYSNIDSQTPNFYAWNDVIGWIDFKSTNTVHVSSTEITGFASSSVGYIALNCNSVPPLGLNVCPSNGGPSQFGVLNDGNGNLSGMAWSDALGWISFKDLNTSAPGYPAYQVTIDTNGDFHGMAWGDVGGWISFNSDNCDKDNGGAGNGFIDVACGGDNATTPVITYKVKTVTGLRSQGVLISSIFNTTLSAGVGLNTLVWQGLSPTGTLVRFQVATDCLPGKGTAPTCTGGVSGWDFIGPNGTGTSYYQGLRDTSIPIVRANHMNKQYLRYKVFLISDPDRIVTPTVYDISLTWSR